MLLQQIFDEQGIELGDEIIIRREIFTKRAVLVVSMDRWLPIRSSLNWTVSC